jgi:hypothetical protein
MRAFIFYCFLLLIVSSCNTLSASNTYSKNKEEFYINPIGYVHNTNNSAKLIIDEKYQ